MKHCSKCGMVLSLDLFYQRKKGMRAGKYYEKCKNCMKIRGRNYYHDNHKRQLKLALIRRSRAYKKKRDFLIKEKDVPCPDCGRCFPFYVMDFDHKDQDKKIKSVSYMFTRNWSLDNIQREIEKCEVVCANCHRIRTYLKLNKIYKLAEVAKVVKARV